MGFDRDCSRVCVPIRIVCVRRVRRSHFHQCSRASTVTPMSIFIYIHEPLHGFAYAHYCTHKRRYGGVGFRNESFPQVEKLPQLFHPHTYILFTPSLHLLTHTTTHHSTPNPNPSKPLILPHSYHL